MNIIYTDNIRPQTEETVNLRGKLSVYNDIDVKGNGIKVDIVNNKIDLIYLPVAPLHVYQNNFYDGVAVYLQQAIAGDVLIKFDSSTQDWFMGIDNSDSNSFKIAFSNDLDTDGAINISTAGDVSLLTGVTVNKILDDDTMADDDAEALVTQQSLVAYIASEASQLLGQLDDGTKVYGKVISGTITEPNYTVDIVHGLSLALTNERILGVLVNMVSGSSIKQVSSADVAYPELSYYDNTYVRVERGSNANDYDIFILLIYK